MTRKFLDNVYDDAQADIETFYDAWAATYEAEVAENGYATPTRCARALADCRSDKSVEILDIGCGTGLSGLALNAMGFDTIDGTDLSAEMLESARAKGVYRDLHHVTETAPIPIELGRYDVVSAIGVIGPGAAPVGMFDRIVEILPAGGLFVFSFNDHALEDPAYEDRLNAHISRGALVLRVENYGPHLPKRNLNSKVYVVEKT